MTGPGTSAGTSATATAAPQSMVAPAAATPAPGPTYAPLQPARTSSLMLSPGILHNLGLSPYLGSEFDYGASPRSVNSDFTRSLFPNEAVPPAQDDARGGRAGNGNDGNEGT